MAAEHLITVNEAAFRVGLSPLTVRRWISQGRIDCVRFGRSVRIPSVSIDNLIAAARTKQEETAAAK